MYGSYPNIYIRHILVWKETEIFGIFHNNNGMCKQISQRTAVYYSTCVHTPVQLWDYVFQRIVIQYFFKISSILQIKDKEKLESFFYKILLYVVKIWRYSAIVKHKWQGLSNIVNHLKLFWKIRYNSNCFPLNLFVLSILLNIYAYIRHV